MCFPLSVILNSTRYLLPSLCLTCTCSCPSGPSTAAKRASAPALLQSTSTLFILFTSGMVRATPLQVTESASDIILEYLLDKNCLCSDPDTLAGVFFCLIIVWCVPGGGSHTTVPM